MAAMGNSSRPPVAGKFSSFRSPTIDAGANYTVAGRMGKRAVHNHVMAAWHAFWLFFGPAIPPGDKLFLRPME